MRAKTKVVTFSRTLALLTLVVGLLGQSSTAQGDGSAAQIRVAGSKQRTRVVGSFAEVEITLNDEIRLSDISALPRAPGSDLEVLDGGRRVRGQLPTSYVDALLDKGAEITVLRKFVLIEGSANQGSSPDGDVTPLAICSGNYFYGESPLNVYIEDNLHWFGSGLDFRGVSGGYIVTCIDVHYEVSNLSWSSIVDVELSDEDYVTYTYRLLSGWWGGDGDIFETETGITAFNGKDLSQIWYLWAADYYADGYGYIDRWWIKLYYEEEEPDYCDAWGLCGYEYISNVAVGTINNSSGCTTGGYCDYTAMSTTMGIGSAYPITVVNGFPDSGDECAIWVDWNQDKDFDDAGETISVNNTPGIGPYTATITPPADANLGDTRMRIRLQWLVSSPFSCGGADDGEVEDYGITIPASSSGTISGTKFNDLDEDGDWDPGEPGISGWEIYLDLNNNKWWDAGEPKEITDVDGYYEFTGLAPGLYVVDEIDQAGWHQTYPGNEGRYTESLDVDEVLTDRNFGNRQISGTLVCLQAIEDTYVDSTNPEANYGSENGITSGRQGGSVYRAYVKFDLSSIPAGQVIIGAILRLENGYISIPAPELEVYRVYDSWDESTLTWNDQPGNAGTGPIFINKTIVSGHETMWDVTRDVDDDYVFDGFYSVKIVSSDEALERSASFWSKDFGWPPMAPTLEVEYEPAFGGGTGEANDPYQIWTGEQFNSIGLYPNRWSKHYKLMDDISLAGYTGHSYNRIGTSRPFSGDGPFKGVFDGNFHSISDFSYFATASYKDTYIALFGYIYDGTIKNLKVLSPNVYTNYYSQTHVGPIAGCIERSDIMGCSVVGGSVDGERYVGGLIGMCMGSYIADCKSSASVSGGSGVGGLIGEGSTAGGFCGITDCYASGPVSGSNYVGGFIGDSSSTYIANCYSTGLVVPGPNSGGFSGYNEVSWPIEENVVGCFWDVVTSNTPNSAAATGLDTAAMQDIDTYLTAGWDFVGELTNGGSDDWAMPPGGGYPVLWHELAEAPALPAFAGGSGTIGDPYLIATVEQLNSIGHNARLMDKHFKLTADLDLGGLTYYMIAPRPYEFSGTFDGDGHTIGSISLEPIFSMSSWGFIGNLGGTGASVQNLTLTYPNVVSAWGWGVGSLVGISEGGSITNCHAVDANVEGLLSVGGLVGGSIWYGKISGCSATGDVSESLIFGPIIYSPAGGLVGENSFWSEIEESYTNCDVTGDDCVGGLVGTNVVYGALTNCYSSGSVTGTVDHIGGLIGRNYAGTEVDYCYSSCVVTGPNGTGGVGGLIGMMGTSGKEYYTSCFWDSEIDGTLPGIGNGTDPNVIGKTTAQMQMESTFTNWDFVDIWDICEGTNYPKLTWQVPMTGDFLCPDGVDMADFSFFAAYWGRNDCEPANGYCDGADTDQDGDVDWLDLKNLVDNWLAGVE